jgi:hypothetical protein
LLFEWLFALDGFSISICWGFGSFLEYLMDFFCESFKAQNKSFFKNLSLWKPIQKSSFEKLLKNFESELLNLDFLKWAFKVLKASYSE